MRFYERLYLGDKAKKNRFSILQAVREEKTSGYYVLTPASNEKNLLDMYSASALNQPYYKQQDFLIVCFLSAQRFRLILLLIILRLRCF